MRFFRPALSCLLLLALAGLAPATSFDRIRYLGGTASSRAGADEWDNTLAVAPEQIVLYLADGQRVKIDPARVTNLSYGQEAHRELTTLVDLGVIVAPVPLLGLLFQTRQHFIGIEYTTAAGEKAGLLIQAHKDNYRAVLMALRGATHAPITVAESDRKFIASAVGDDGVRTAPPAPKTASPESSSPPPASPAAAAPPAQPAPPASTGAAAPEKTPPPASPEKTPAPTAPEKAPAPAAPAGTPPPSDSTDPSTTRPAPAPRPAPAAVEKGTITLSTNPSGASIFVDGRFVGQTPAKLRLAPGPHTIRLSLSGYPDWSQDLEVLEASEVTLQIELSK